MSSRRRLCRLGAKTIIVQDLPRFLPKQERDAAQILSDAFARDGLEVRLNTTVLGVRVEAGELLAISGAMTTRAT